ncbi:hypothetical protein DOTSEDRAFT_69625, partial [Dothistroma septosporum NZE10]
RSLPSGNSTQGLGAGTVRDCDNNNNNNDIRSFRPALYLDNSSCVRHIRAVQLRTRSF